MLPNTSKRASTTAKEPQRSLGVQHVNPGPVRVIKGQTDAGKQQTVIWEKKQVTQLESMKGSFLATLALLSSALLLTSKARHSISLCYNPHK